MSELGQVVQALNHQQLVAYLDVVASTIFLYDYVLTLRMEIDLVWYSKWTLLKILYLVQRYAPFYDTVGLVLYHQFVIGLSPSYCLVNYKISGWSFISSIAISEVILALRLWAVWRKSLKIAVGLSLFFLACWVANFVVMGIFLNSMAFAKSPFPYPGCFIVAGSHILAVCWILLMVYDAGNLVMMVIPGFAAYRTGGSSQLVRVVYRDGVIYYVYIFLVSLVNVIVINRLPPDLVHLLSSFERILHCILTSRIVLHIREIGAVDHIHGTDTVALTSMHTPSEGAQSQFAKSLSSGTLTMETARSNDRLEEYILNDRQNV